MKIVTFLNGLGLGGTEKAAATWSRGLCKREHALCLLSLQDGPRRNQFEQSGVEVRIVPATATAIRDQLQSLRPDVIHAHAPGHPHAGDVLGIALASMPKIPVLQTNVFGQMDNPKENEWTDFRLFVSWTSCVQAARRKFRRLDEEFFRSASVAVYPVDPEEPPPQNEIDAFREKHGVREDEVLFGRLSRPEPNKWTDLPIHGFRIAAKRNPRIKLLLREPPALVRQHLLRAVDHDRFIILPMTDDAAELRLTTASLDAVLHTSVMGESFGYGIAEPMNLAKPIIANSTPWLDQAQIELVRHGECGFIASTPKTIASRIAAVANDRGLRTALGERARDHIRKLADPNLSTDRVEGALHAVVSREPNPHRATDVRQALATAIYLDTEQFGHTWREQFMLRQKYYRASFHRLRQWRY